MREFLVHAQSALRSRPRVPHARTLKCPWEKDMFMRAQVLLQRTSLLLERGHRYAVVGQNGVGKTTLLNRVAARDINGFPEDISCYYGSCPSL